MTAELVSLDQLAALREADLTVLYSDGWDEECRGAADVLYDARAPFIAIFAAMTAETRRDALVAGALYAFGREDMDNLSLIFANMNRSVRRPETGRFLLANGFVVDLVQRRLHRDDRYFDLSPTQCRFLATLGNHARSRPGVPLSFHEINLAVWGSPTARTEPTVRGYVSQLRGKIEVIPEKPTVLLGRRGMGYWLELCSVVSDSG